jgi:hypothetical protein
VLKQLTKCQLILERLLKIFGRFLQPEIFARPLALARDSHPPEAGMRDFGFRVKSTPSPRPQTCEPDLSASRISDFPVGAGRMQINAIPGAVAGPPGVPDSEFGK